jgi:hypothetical protein
MALRQIERAWVEATINQPEHSEPDPHDPALTQMNGLLVARMV